MFYNAKVQKNPVKKLYRIIYITINQLFIKSTNQSTNQPINQLTI